jgi:hypothetical protein
VPVPYFLLFLCFRKATQEIFSELDETKAEPPIFTEASQSLKMRRRGARGQPHPRVAWPRPWLRHQGVSRPGPPPDVALPPIYSPRREKPKDPINFPQNLLQATVIVDARSGGSRSSSRHPAEEGNHHGRPSSPPWSLQQVAQSFLQQRTSRLCSYNNQTFSRTHGRFLSGAFAS